MTAEYGNPFHYSKVKGHTNRELTSVFPSAGPADLTLGSVPLQPDFTVNPQMEL